MRTSIYPDLLDVAEGQHGLVARRQALQYGLSRSAWRHLVGTADWAAITPQVARRVGAPVTLQQRTLAAVLDLGPPAYVSHRSAAALWGLTGFSVQPIDVMVLRGGRETKTELGIVHRPRHLPDPFAAVLDDVPVVRPALVLLQLAPLVSPQRLRRLLDRLWARRLLSGPSVRRELDGLMHRGRPGTAALRALLDSLPPDYVPPASGLEGRFAHILERAGLSAMRRQVDLGDDSGWCGRVDFVDAEVPLVAEVDSDRYHLALTDVEADRARQERLAAAGFTVIRFTEGQIWHQPDEVVRRVRVERQRLRPARRPS
jgi:very-short-patch-repair endonuclease